MNWPLHHDFEIGVQKKYCFTRYVFIKGNLNMKYLLALVILLVTFESFAEVPCKTLKTCSEWASNKTGAKYDYGTLGGRSLKFEKDFDILEGESDFNFNYLLQANDLARIKREGGYQIIAMKDLKDFKFPSVAITEIPSNLDFYTIEFSFSNKSKVKNALWVIKKFLSKNGRLLEVADSPQIQVVDTGIHLNSIKLVVNELNK